MTDSLPEPAIDVDGVTRAFNARKMLAYAQQQVALERQRCASIAEGAHQLKNNGDDFANGWTSAALQIKQAISMGDSALN